MPLSGPLCLSLSLSTSPSISRGFGTLDAHVICETYLSTKLYQREQALNAPLATIDTEDQVQGVVYQTARGACACWWGGVYMIDGHLPADIPLRWFVQCVVLAGSVNE